MKNKPYGAFRLRKRSQVSARLGFFGFRYFAALLSLLLLFVFPLVALASPTQADPTTPTITAQAGIAVDTSTGLITFGKNIHRRAPMASTTKIMTALTALAAPGTNLNDRYTVQKEDLVGEASMGLRAGENVSFSDLLYGMLLNSGNDAAEAIARYVGAKLPGNGDPVQRFVDRMNAQATAYGLRNTHYANPHGLDQADHYSSPFDLAITGWYALQNPTISNIVRQQQATVAGHNLVNINTFLKRYSGANGIKPGFTDGAGFCLVASATRNGATAISVVMDTDQAGFTNDTTALLNYTFTIISQQPASARAGNPPAGGGPLNTTAQYIGHPKGNLLVPDTSNSAAIPANNASNPYLNAPAAGFNAQINTPPPDTTATITTPGAGSDDNGSNSAGSADTTKKQSGGLNFFVILIVLLIIGLILFGVARAGYIGGETGRNVALRVEDMAIIGFRSARSGLGRLLTQFKPGDHPDSEPPPDRSNSAIAERNQPVPPAQRDYRDRVNPRPYQSEASGTTQNPARPRSGSRSQPLGQNPLEGFFDDVQPFELEDKPASGKPGETLKPPQPIPPRPTASPLTNRSVPVEKEKLVSPARPAPSTSRNEAQPRPDLNSPVDRLRPPQPLAPRPNPPATSTPATRNEKPETPGERNYFGGASFTPAPKDNAESTMARARQAIDYAYAGRLQASTDEFRKVVEQDSMFDFGSLEEFEQMPVLGFKALANAYSAVGHQKFALLLLDMAIEKYPNDLELRNLMRTFKREMGQK